MVEGERVKYPSLLMLGDTVHFTKAALESNRDRDYKVVAIRLDSFDVEAESTFQKGDHFRYTILGSQMEELGTEIVY